MNTIFITGGTGYIGSRLIKRLIAEGEYNVRALVRQGSAHKLPEGCLNILGDALDAKTYCSAIAPATVFIHLVGVAHPSPSKKAQFSSIDLLSVHEAAKAAAGAGIRHFIYLSVAMYPTRIMKDFQETRAKGEAVLCKQDFNTSFIRPWYVIGPGHRWPLLLKPLYWLAKLIPSKREAAKQLETVTITQVIDMLIYAVAHEPDGNVIYDVQRIREC